MIERNKYKKIIGSLLVIQLFVVSPVAFTATDADQGGKIQDIEVITVQARKHTEPLQEVPVAVSVLTGKEIERTFSQKVESIDKFIPNVELGKMQFGGGALTAGIRGISYAEVERTFEPAVGMSVDGVFFGTGVGAMVDLLDIESVEVLRGPQGTLFGRNTMGGVINLRRAKPTGEFGVKGELTFGSYGRNDYKLIVNTPTIGESLAAKFYVYDLNGDLFSKNIYTGERDKGMDQVTFGTKVMFTPTDEIEAIFSYDHVNDESRYPGVVNLSQSNNLFCIIGSSVLGVAGCQSETAALVEGYGYDFDDYDTEVSTTPFVASIKSDLYSLTLDWDLSEQLQLSSITGYQKVSDVLDAEVTAVPDLIVGGNHIPLFRVRREQEYNQFSQEFKLASDYDTMFNFVAGAYYFTSDYKMKPQDGFFLGGDSFQFYTGQDVKAYALFAETYWDLADKLRLTVGGRYTSEEKKFSKRSYQYKPGTGEQVLGFSCPDASSTYGPCVNPVADWSKFSPRVSFDYKFTDDIMAYASYSQGFRSGGWVGRAQIAEGIGPFDPETLDSYEVGMRSELLDNKLRLNLTGFYMNYKDKQEDYTVTYTNVFGVPSTTSFVENAAQATIKGLELESVYTVTTDFKLKAAIGYLDAGYDEYNIPGETEGTFINVSDQRHYRFAPDYTFSLGAEYFLDLGEYGELAFVGNYKHTAEFWVTPLFDTTGNKRDLIESYNQVDMSVSYDPGSFYKVSLFVDNLTNADPRLFRKFDAGSFWFGDKEVGRTFGVSIGFNF
ncbi:MAG: iron complex outermembrane receptor protein [Shewanella sp.]|jgi:iron complex outermembrane receptor protein